MLCFVDCRSVFISQSYNIMFVTTCVQCSNSNRKYNVFIVFILFCTFTATHVSSEVLKDNETCADLYENGVLAYLENNFNGCIKSFEKAIKKHRLYTETLQNCRIKCRENTLHEKPSYKEDIEDLHFYERIIKNTLCILKCKSEYKSIFGIYNINKETDELFENKKPYEYLHICYFQTKKYQKAASAAFTYLVSYPNDKAVLASLKHYSTFSEVDVDDITNLEAKDYVNLYVHGSNAYDNKDWDAVAQNMEESLVAYLQAEEECRAHCEGPFDPGWYPDFVPSIANHFTYSLRCKKKCKERLSSLNTEKYDDLLPSHYHYLQYAYYKLGDIEAAGRCASSYLLFYPKDKDMNKNLVFYKKLPNIKPDFFIPRKEAASYTKRDRYENKLLTFISKEFSFDKSIFPGENEVTSSTNESKKVTAH